jgi:iron complex outermembrane receptor protein
MRGIDSRVLVTSAFVLAWLWPGAAAAQHDRATVTGVVTAADGARLPGVPLRLTNTHSGVDIEAVSSDAGLFSLGDLPPGQYELHAELSGFEPRRITGIVLERGQSLSLRVGLEVASVRESVHVVGTASRDTVQAFEMRESRARDLGEAMAALPGLVKLRKGAIANDIVMRGLQGKDVTVLIDGQRIDGACPGHMDPPAFHVDFAEVSRVEVSKGPFDVKNQGGSGGVVNVVTERPQRGWHGSGDLTIASADTFASSASASFGGSRWAALGGASTRRADPYRDGGGTSLVARGGYRADIQASVPAYDVWTAWGRTAFVPRNGTTLQLSYTRQSADTIVYPYLQMDGIFDHADRAGARLETANLPGGWSGLAVHLYFTRVDHWMTDQFRTTGVNRPREYSMGTRAKTEVLGGRAEARRGPLAAGVEASSRNWNTTTMLAMQGYAPQAGVPDATIDVVGGFATYSPELTGAWSIDAGVRLDRAESTADPALANTALYAAYHGTAATRAVDVLPGGHARARWRHETGWSATFGVGHSARPPDQQERYYALKRSGADWVGNPGLSPMRNTGLDGELRYSGRGIDVALAGFLYRLDDAIVVAKQLRLAAVPGVMNLAARSYANVDALMRGIEASATVPLARTVYLSADGSLVRGTVRGGAWVDADLAEMPPPRARVRLRYDNARWHGLAEVVASARQDDVVEALGETPTPAFASVNLRAAVRLGAVTVNASVDNVLDALYSEHLSFQRDPFRNGTRVYEPGRTISIGAGLRF